MVALILLLNTCGKNLEDPDPPSRPEWVAKSLPYDTTETGIDAVPNGDFIQLEWYTGDEDDLSSYRIYRASGDIENKFDLIEEIQSDLMAGSINIYLDENVSINIPYFYFLRAVDQAGNLSLRSDTVEYKLVVKVNLRGLFDTTDVKPTFKWSDAGSAASEYVIRVEQFNPNRVIWISALTPQNYSGDIQSLVYGSPDVFYLAQSELSSGVSYRWRIDIVSALDRENEAGSESYWGYFTVQ